MARPTSYVASGNGIEILHTGETDPAKVWSHFSNQRVSDLSFGPDGRLWGVAFSGSEILSANPSAMTDIVSFVMSDRAIGRAELAASV